MRKPVRVAAAVAIVAAIAFAAPASAQIAPSMSGRSSTRTIDDGESWRTIVGFGNCFARRYPNDVLALLATDPGSAAEDEVFRDVIRRRASVCLSGGDQVRMPRWIIRGAALEGLYRQRVEVPAHLMLAAPAPGTAQSLRAAALCYAAGHPDQVRALVDNSRAGSEDEFEALSAMAEDFFSCFPQSVATGDLDPTVVRYRLIEAALRLPVAATSARDRP